MRMSHPEVNLFYIYVGIPKVPGFRFPCSHDIFNVVYICFIISLDLLFSLSGLHLCAGRSYESCYVYCKWSSLFSFSRETHEDSGSLLSRLKRYVQLLFMVPYYIHHHPESPAFEMCALCVSSVFPLALALCSLVFQSRSNLSRAGLLRFLFFFNKITRTVKNTRDCGPHGVTLVLSCSLFSQSFYVCSSDPAPDLCSRYSSIMSLSSTRVPLPCTNP